VSIHIFSSGLGHIQITKTDTSQAKRPQKGCRYNGDKHYLLDIQIKSVSHIQREALLLTRRLTDIPLCRYGDKYFNDCRYI